MNYVDELHSIMTDEESGKDIYITEFSVSTVSHNSKESYSLSLDLNEEGLKSILEVLQSGITNKKSYNSRKKMEIEVTRELVRTIDEGDVYVNAFNLSEEDAKRIKNDLSNWDDF